MKYWLIAAAFSLAACSNGGGKSKAASEVGLPSGSTADTVTVPVSDEPGGEIAAGTIETSIDAVVSADGPQLFASPNRDIRQTFAEQLNSIAFLPLGPEEVQTSTEVGPCGGTSTTTTTTISGEGSNIYPIQSSAVAVYNDYCQTSGPYQVIMNGRVTVEITLGENGDGPISYGYDLSYTSVGLDIEQSGRMVVNQYCSSLMDIESCYESADFVSTQGNSYSLNNYDVSSSNGIYSVSGSFTINDGTTYQYDAQGLSLCDNGYFGTGSITLSSSDGEYLAVEFTSCTEYSYVYEGQAYTVSY